MQSELTTGSCPVRGWHVRASLCVRPWPTRGLAPHAQVWYTQGNSSKSPEPHTLQEIRFLKSSSARVDVDAPDQVAVSLAPTATRGASTPRRSPFTRVLQAAARGRTQPSTAPRAAPAGKTCQAGFSASETTTSEADMWLGLAPPSTLTLLSCDDYTVRNPTQLCEA